ncbi:ATP-binding protein [Streptomyces sp. NPDC002994]|uniref:ATP-binding protein n=1 Tax=Streptomyces sp. NPDC002994 TaxID=3154441 RepID=UPI0033B716FD
MPRSWPGQSARDRAVEAYVESLLLPGPDTAPRRPVTLLLGPRGSGKTTLLEHLYGWAHGVPRAWLDVAERAGRNEQPVDVLAAIAAGLPQHDPQVKNLQFRAFDIVVQALSVQIRGLSDEAARRAVGAELARPRSGWLGLVLQLAQIAAGVAGLPAAVGYVLQLLPLAGQSGILSRTRLRLSPVLRGRTAGAGLGLLVALNRAYNEGPPGQRSFAEQFVCRALLDDLRRCYRKKDWAVRSLVLLDNIDNRLGRDVLRLLREARTSATDPLVVLATAGSYPHGLPAVPVGPQSGPAFAPQPIDEGLTVGRLPDLTRAEVDLQARDILEEADALAPPRVENGTRWLGWAVYELTRGQPEGTRQVLAGLLEFDRAVPWEVRLRQIFAPSNGLAGRLLERLLPFGLEHQESELYQALLRASVAPDLAQAQVTPELLAAGVALQQSFNTFCTDPLRTLHLDTGDEAADGPVETPHPLLRRLLRYALDDPAAVHAGRRAEAEGLDEPGAAAYHALACGDLPAAAAYLDGLIEQVGPKDWYAELARLRRAPLPASVVGGEAPGTLTGPWGPFERFVRHLGGEGVDPRLRTVTRLLAASWIAPEPLEPDRVGDPYRDPLGDPYAELYTEINARLHTLVSADTHVLPDRVAWTSVLLNKAGHYREMPWQ